MSSETDLEYIIQDSEVFYNLSIICDTLRNSVPELWMNRGPDTAEYAHDLSHTIADVRGYILATGKIADEAESFLKEMS